MTEKIVIRKGFYWSAGRKFGWKESGNDVAGVGIAKSILQSNKEIILEIDGKDYKLECEKARNFVNRYKAAENHNGTWIGIISKSLLQRV